ncbi:uncharacterized protein LOC132264104 isoform X2 [Phlebotomus argentipes]|uniref:uncharacterized protein LOC132264104 isoform X2 n=1 Tax=Phlebotomus argentipes TaxID=94469 RepID=UPI00289371E9|nr:uncharacterized protein LOC132264104 isoform X2 [Phlebotomus argentipes]
MYAAEVATMLAKGDFFLDDTGKEENLTRFGNFWDSLKLFLQKIYEEGQTTDGYELLLKQISDISRSTDKHDQTFFIKDVRKVVEKVEKLESCALQSDLFDALLEIVLRYIGSQFECVRSNAVNVLLELQTSPLFCENNFIEVIKKVLNPDSSEAFVLLQIMYTVAPIIGNSNTDKYLWPTFLWMTNDPSHSCIVKQALVRTLGMFCRILGSECTEVRLWPIYVKLSKDSSWRVRQHCARILPIVSLFSSPKERDQRVAPLIKRFLTDPNRFVFLVASDMLGIYLATFANPRILTVYVNTKMELSLPNPADEDFKECLQKESEREKFASYEEMFSQTLDRHSYKASSESLRPDRGQEILYPLDVGGKILEKYFRLSNLPVKLHLAGSDEAHRRRELEDYFDNMSYDCWLMDFKNIISDRIKFDEGNLSEFFPYHPAVDEQIHEEDLMGIGAERKSEQVLALPLPAPPPPMKSLSANALEEEEDDDSDEESSTEMEELLQDLQEEAPELWRKLAHAHSKRKLARKAAAKSSPSVEVENIPPATVESESPSVSAPVASISPIQHTAAPASTTAGESEVPAANSSAQTEKNGQPVVRAANTQCHLKRNTPHDLRDIISQAIEDSSKRKVKLQVDMWKKEAKEKGHLPPPPQTASIENASVERNYFLAPSSREMRATFAEIVSRGIDMDDGSADRNENIVSDFNDNPSSGESCVVLDSTEESVMFRKTMFKTCDRAKRQYREHHDARKALLTRSRAVTSSDSNENWCCDQMLAYEKNGNGEKQQCEEEDDEAKEFNSHNFWYIAPESVSIAEISMCCEKSESSEVPTMSPVLDDASMASLPMRNLSESSDDSFCKDSVYRDLEKTRSHISDGNIDAGLLKQDVLPPDLLQSFITKANADKTEVSVACAYSFPAVALTLGRQNWHLLLRTLQKLCANHALCHIMINSFYHIALIVGRENATKDLLPLYLRFFDNVTRIRREALKIVHNFLSTVDEARHVDVIAKLPICLADFHKTNETKYHVRENFMNVVLSLMNMYDRKDAPVDCVNYLTAYALAMLVDKVHHVRELALEALVVRVRTCHERDFANLLQVVTEECGESSHWRNRQTFVQLVHRWVEEDFIDMRVFVRDILPRLLVLSTDRVPNIRLVVGRCLFKTVGNHPHFAKASMEDEKTRIQEVIERLANDTDVDVRESCGGVVRRFSESLQYCDDTKEAEDIEGDVNERLVDESQPEEFKTAEEPEMTEEKRRDVTVGSEKDESEVASGVLQDEEDW